jgi:CBS-domain-containing membrane protein
MMWTNKQFWLDSSWRSFRTFCQTLAALFGAQAVNLFSVPWSSILGTSLGAALVSLLMSVDRERAVEWVSNPNNTAAVSDPLPAKIRAVQGVHATREPGCGGALR